MGNQRHPGPALDGSQCGQNRWRCAAGAGDRNVFQLLQRIQTILRSLGGDRVANAVFGFSQYVGVVWKLPLSEISRLFAMSRWVKPACCALVRSTSTCRCGSSKGCWIRRSAAPGNRLDPAQQLVRKLTVGLKVVSHDLNIDRRRQSEVQNLADDVGRQERKIDAGKFVRPTSTASRGRIPRWAMVRGQGDHDVGVGRAVGAELLYERLMLL